MFNPKYLDTVIPEYLGCYEIHVRKLGSIIAIGCLFFRICYIPIIIKSQFWLYIPFILIASLADIAVLLADKFEKPVLYRPFLIVNGVLLIVGILEIVALTSFISHLPMIISKFGFYKKSDSNSFILNIFLDYAGHEKSMLFILSMILILLVVVEAIKIYYWDVVHRAQAYMTAEVVSKGIQKNGDVVEWNPIYLQNFAHSNYI